MIPALRPMSAAGDSCDTAVFSQHSELLSQRFSQRFSQQHSNNTASDSAGLGHRRMISATYLSHVVALRVSSLAT